MPLTSRRGLNKAGRRRGRAPGQSAICSIGHLQGDRREGKTAKTKRSLDQNADSEGMGLRKDADHAERFLRDEIGKREKPITHRCRSTWYYFGPADLQAMEPVKSNSFDSPVFGNTTHPYTLNKHLRDGKNRRAALRSRCPRTHGKPPAKNQKVHSQRLRRARNAPFAPPPIPNLTDFCIFFTTAGHDSSL